MMFSYLRHSLEGIIQSIYGFNRGDMICPVDEKFCPYKKPEFLLKVSFENDRLFINDVYTERHFWTAARKNF